MTRILLAVAFICALLLTSIAYELHGLNERLDFAAARNWGLPVSAPRTTTVAVKPETRQERLDREVREMRQLVDDSKYRLNRLLADDGSPAPAPR